MNRRTFLTRAGQTALATAAGRFAAARLGAAADSVTVAAVGDCILTRKVSQIRNERFLQVVKLLRDADCAYGNCEMTFVDARTAEPTAKGADMNLVCEPWGTDELSWMGFDVLGTANNHSMDYGRDGLVSTIANLDRVGIGHAGTGVTLGEAARPGYVDTPAGRVALINCASTFPAWSLAEAARGDSNGRPGLNPLRVDRTYRVEPALFEEMKRLQASLFPRPPVPPGVTPPPAPPADSLTFMGNRFTPGTPTDILSVASPVDVKRLTDAVAIARRNAHIVLVSIHAHENYKTRETPATFLQPFARACIDAGADAFLGAGPHLLRGIELYKGKPICYSLGNFFFEYATVKQIPAEVYEANRLDPNTLDPSVSYDTFAFPRDAVYWESVVPLMTFRDGRLADMKLHPVVLDQQAPRYARGLPMMATPEEGQSILERMTKLSAAFGTTISTQGGVGAVRLAG